MGALLGRYWHPIVAELGFTLVKCVPIAAGLTLFEAYPAPLGAGCT
jgi:hypothetical protein